MSECERKCCYKSRCTWYGFRRNGYGFFWNGMGGRWYWRSKGIGWNRGTDCRHINRVCVRENFVTEAVVRGTASGLMFMAFFGTVWADIGIGGLRVSVAIWLMILAILIGAALFFSGIMMIRQSRHLPNINKFRNAKNV